MRTINIKPVEIVGNCRARLTPEDEFQIKGMKLENPGQSSLCFQALGHFPPIISQLQRGNHFFAHVTCPDCLSNLNDDTHVVFLLGHADKWELCQAISEYRGLCEQTPPSEVARQLKGEATRHQKRGEYSAAAQKMEAAVAAVKRSVIFPE